MAFTGGDKRKVFPFILKKGDSWQRPGRDLAEIWQRPGSDLAETWQRPDRDLAETWQRPGRRSREDLLIFWFFGVFWFL